MRRLRVVVCLSIGALLFGLLSIGANQRAQATPPAAVIGDRRLVANMHGLLFHDDTRDLQEDVSYAQWLGAGAIRAFATDNNSVRPWDGQRVGSQIVRLAPMLRASSMKLIVALVNNHRAVPGEAAGSSGLLDNYQQLLLPFFTATWRDQYLTFSRDLIGAVRDADVLDVIGAWELGNELHTPEDPAALIPFVSQAAAEIRAVDPSTPILAGTMGANHVEPGAPDSAIARWLYCEAPLDGYTLHAYDWMGPDRPGDMPIDWDLANITAQPCPDGRVLPVIVEELGTSRALDGVYQSDDQATRLVYELRQLQRVLRYPQVAGVGVWNAESPRVGDATFFDSRRGLTSYGGHAQGGGSCYDPRPDPAPGPRCEYEQVLRQLASVWPDTQPSAWVRSDGSPADARVAGMVDPVSGDSSMSVSGWVLDTANPDNPAVEAVDLYLGTPGQGGSLLASSAPAIVRSDLQSSSGSSGWDEAGFQLQVPGDALPAGIANLTLVARTTDGVAWSRGLAAIVPGTLVSAPAPVVQIAPPRLQVTSPNVGATVSSGQVVQGSASDPGASVGSGIDRVQIFLQPGRDAGGKLIGTATLGRANPDAFTFVLRVPRGPQTLYIYAHSALSGRETLLTLPLKVS